MCEKLIKKYQWAGPTPDKLTQHLEGWVWAHFVKVPEGTVKRQPGLGTTALLQVPVKWWEHDQFVWVLPY